MVEGGFDIEIAHFCGLHDLGIRDQANKRITALASGFHLVETSHHLIFDEEKICDNQIGVYGVLGALQRLGVFTPLGSSMDGGLKAGEVARAGQCTRHWASGVAIKRDDGKTIRAISS